MVRRSRQDLMALIAASNAVRSCKHLHQLLQLVLLIGNYLNAGSSNAGSFGFKLSFLTQLRSTKSVDNQSTLLHYLAEVLFC
jgi:hypothetical protein